MMGLVNRVVPDNMVAEVAGETVRMIAANAPIAPGSAKVIFGGTGNEESECDLEEWDSRMKAYFDSKDDIEGRRAFLETRKPYFAGS